MTLAIDAINTACNDIGSTNNRAEQNKARLGRAVALVSEGRVQYLGENSTVVVSTESRDYRFEKASDICTCPDRHQAPDQECKHKLAQLIYRRAHMLTQLDSEEESPMVDEPTNPEYHDHEEEIPTEESALPITTRYVRNTNIEPSSLTIKAISPTRGYELLICLRDQDVQTMFSKCITAIKWLDEHGCKGPYAAVAATPAHNGQTEQPQSQSPEEHKQICDYHHMEMKKGIDKKTGNVFWSHQVGNKWCRGKWCVEHSTTYYRNTKDGRSWWSHKTNDGSYCRAEGEKS